ncbi:ABC transporter A family member 9-like protein [Tanacetum coccineum]
MYISQHNAEDMTLHAIGKSKENAQSSLSRWTRQGYFTCPTCNLDSPSVRVRGKTAYVGHKRFLHKNKKAFNGQIDMTRPQSFTNEDIMKQLSKFPIHIPGKHPHVKHKKSNRKLVQGFLLGIFIETMLYRVLGLLVLNIVITGRNKPLHPADMLLYSWDKGLDVYVDLTGSSPFTQIGMVDFVPGQAVIDVAQRKRKANAVILLKWIRKFSMAQDIGARATVYIFNMISFAIAKGVGS